MEISTSPHRPATTPWGRLLALVVILGPVSVLVLLPIGLGLQRYVVTGSSMEGDRPDSISRGSLVLERLVPVDDLRVGDVITFRAPPGSDVHGTVTHRIVSVGTEGIRTRGDASTAVDPWLLRPTGTVVPRVAYTLPWVGYAYLMLADWRWWGAALVVLVILGLAVVAGHRARTTPPGRVEPGPREASEPAEQEAATTAASSTAPGGATRGRPNGAD